MFNLSKHADFADMVSDAADTLEQGMVEPENVTIPEEDIINNAGPDANEKQRILDLTNDEKLIGLLQELKGDYPAEVEAIDEFLQNNHAYNALKNELAGLAELKEQYNMEALAPQVGATPEHEGNKKTVIDSTRRLRSIRREQEKNQLPLAAFNLKVHKQGQVANRFPVVNQGDFVEKFVDDLLAYNHKPGTQPYELARVASEEIRKAVSPAVEEEANSVLESIMQLDGTIERDKAVKHLLKLYEVLLPDMVKGNEGQMEPTMSNDKIDGIVSYSLTESILNNKQADAEGITKTAADQFGQQYLLYGPTEKRICPKLRGKNLSVGDVVSEYTCRHHCIDGIAIDDNKTICGEALWRANAMDKFSREYVDEDGNIVGGYLNKRFEINRNVPEETKQRLKPGETRKPLPPSWRSTESRLQDMRAKEGQARDYRPKTNTGDPFEWCHDSDQNNVEISQTERDRREEASGNQLVQYDNRNQGENNPKKAFNLKSFKTAQITQPMAPPQPSDQHQTKVNPSATNIKQPVDIDLSEPTVDQGKPMEAPAKAMPKNLLRVTDPWGKPTGEPNDECLSCNASCPGNDFCCTQCKDNYEEAQGVRALESRMEGPDGPSLEELYRQKRHGFNLSQHKEAKEKGVTYKGEHFEYNPWAVCNKSTGGKNKAGKEKFERCVQHVKDQSRGKEMESEAQTTEADDSKKKS